MNVRGVCSGVTLLRQEGLLVWHLGWRLYETIKNTVSGVEPILHPHTEGAVGNRIIKPQTSDTDSSSSIYAELHTLLILNTHLLRTFFVLNKDKEYCL